MGTTQKKNGGLWARLTALMVALLMTTAQMKAQVAKIVEKDISYNSVQEAINAASDGNTVRILCDVAENIVVDRTGMTITLDLNGKTLRPSKYDKPSPTDDYAFLITVKTPLIIDDSSEGKTGLITTQGTEFKTGGVYATANITLNNGTITTSRTGTVFSNGGGVYVQTGSTFTMNGGAITGCEAIPGEYQITNGGGVYINDGASFVMNDGIISNNSSDKGGGVSFNGGNRTFTMTGGTITGNTTAKNIGGGVYMWGATDIVFNVGGTAKIYGNTGNNVYLDNNATMTVNPAFAEGAQIYVTTSTAPTTGNPVAVTSNGTANDVQYFKSDNTQYATIYKDSEVKLAVIGGNVCQIVETSTMYTTIADAINALTEAGQTIQLISNVSLTEVLDISYKNKNFILDLNGYALKQTASDASVISNGGTLTINDSRYGQDAATHYLAKNGDTYSLSDSPTDYVVKGGVITGGNSVGGISNRDGGNLTLNAGIICGNKTGSLTGYAGGLGNMGTFTMTGGEICYNYSSGNSGGLDVNSNVSTTVSGGKIHHNTASSYGGGVLVRGSKNLTMTGGEVSENTASKCGGIGNYGNTTIGGTAKVTGNTASSLAPNLGINVSGSLTISTKTPLALGAAFGVTKGDTYFWNSIGGQLTTNGTANDAKYFTSDNDSYVVSYNSAGYLELATPVCMNTTTNVKYATVQEAVNAAGTGHTIQMLANSTENVTVPNGKDITLKLNGKVLTAKNTSGTVITNNGTLTLIDSGGGNITGGAKGVEQNGTMTVGGKLNITGNTADFYLSANNTVAVSLDTPLVNGANIRVTTETTPTGSSPVAITSNRGEDYGYFTSAAGYFVTNIDGVVKGVLQYTIHFRKGSNNVTCGGEPFNDKDVTMTYGGSTADVPVLEKAGNTFIGWNTSNLASAAQYQTADLNTICSQHGGEVDLYPVWAINTGVPVNVALDNGSDIPAIGRKYTFNIEAITEGAPMPAATTLQLNAPTAAGEANKVGYDASSLDNPWRMFLPKGVYSYVITQTNDAQEAETMDEGSWTMTFDVDPYSDTPECETTFSQYKGKVDPMTINSFHIVKKDNNVAADVTVDEQDRTRLVLGGNKVVGGDAFNTAVIKGKFEIDFNRNFTATGSLTLPPSATPDGTLVGFIANPTVPQSSDLDEGGSLGIIGSSVFSNGVVLEFDPYDNGSSHADPGYKHFTLETLDGNACPTAVEHWNMNSQWPTGSCSYTIDNDIKNNKLTFTVTLPGGASKTYTYNDPKSAFGTNVSKAYLIMSGVVRYGKANTYGLGAVGSTAPSLTMYFDSFYYYGQKEGFVEQSIFVNKLDHVWQYTAEGNVLKAQCKHDFSDETLTTHCTLPGVKNLTVTSYSKNYDGGSCQAATYTTDEWTEIGLEKPTIKYSGVSPTTYDETTSTPCTFGKYQATAKMGDNVAAAPFVIRPQIYCTTADAVHGSVAITDKTTDTVIASGSFIEPYQEIILTATAVGHWHFTNWTNGTTVVGTDNPWTFLMNENVKNYTANFAIDKHTVTAMPNVPAFGSVSIQDVTLKNGDGSVSAQFDYGTNVQLTATPAGVEYTFLYWTKVSDTTAVISRDNEFKFTLEQDTTFKAIFVNEVAVNIYANSSDGGEVNIYDNVNKKYLTEEERQHIKYGTSVTIGATAFNESGFAFAGWFNKATGEYFSKTQKFTFEATEDLELEARFTDQVIWVRVKKGN